MHHMSLAAGSTAGEMAPREVCQQLSLKKLPKLGKSFKK